MTLRSRCPHCQQTQPIEAGTNAQAALACRSCGQSYVPQRHLFVSSSNAPASAERASGAPSVADTPPLTTAPATQGKHDRWWVASLVLALMLLTQIALSQRDLWSAQWPLIRAPLQMLCGWFGCEVKAPQMLSAVALVSSGFDQQDDGAFVLGLHMRHALDHEVATPAVELTLNDDFDRPVLRKVLVPRQLGLPDRLAPGDGSSTELTLDLDPELQPHVSGFRIELFYP